MFPHSGGGAPALLVDGLVGLVLLVHVAHHYVPACIMVSRFAGGSQPPVPPAVAHRLLLSALILLRRSSDLGCACGVKSARCIDRGAERVLGAGRAAEADLAVAEGVAARLVVDLELAAGHGVARLRPHIVVPLSTLLSTL